MASFLSLKFQPCDRTPQAARLTVFVGRAAKKVAAALPTTLASPVRMPMSSGHRLRLGLHGFL